MKATPTLLLSAFTLGVTLITPMTTIYLGIDFYERKFPHQHIAVKVAVCYEVSYVVLQLCCLFWESKLPISRAARIELRRLVVAVLMSLLIIWEKLIAGPPGLDPPSYAAGLLLGLVTAVGCFDGLAVGAIFGEMALIGAGAAHVLVAGTAGVLPLLAILRVILKTALPETAAGLRLSIIIYLATSVLILLVGVMVYTIIVLPAVAAMNQSTEKSTGTSDKIGGMPLLPTISDVSDIPSEPSYAIIQQAYTGKLGKSVEDEGLQAVDSTSDLDLEIIYDACRHGPIKLRGKSMPPGWKVST